MITPVRTLYFLTTFLVPCLQGKVRRNFRSLKISAKFEADVSGKVIRCENLVEECILTFVAWFEFSFAST